MMFPETGIGAQLFPEELSSALNSMLELQGVDVRTRGPDIYAAGDVASYPCPVLGRRRLEHEDHANASGIAAGHAMAGEPEPYDHPPKP